MRVSIISFLLVLLLPLKPNAQKTGKMVIDNVDVKSVYTVYNGDLMGDPCNVVMFVEACLTRGYNPNHLSRVIEHESGYNLKAINPIGGASGLIQFVPSTARGYGTSVRKIRSMNFEQQLRLTMYHLDCVERDYGFINDSIDMYLAVFNPASITKRDRGYTRIFTEGSRVYTNNRVNDFDKDGDIDLKDIGRLMRYNQSKIDTVEILTEIRLVSRMPNMIL